MSVAPDSQTLPPPSAASLWGLALGGVIIPFALYALWVLGNKVAWTSPVAVIPGLVLALSLPVWAAFHIAQWVQARGGWWRALALAWALLAVWTAWQLPDADAPIFGRFYVLVPILAMSLGLIPPGSRAMIEKFSKKSARPFRWGLLAGLVAAGFAVGLTDFVPETPARLLGWQAQAALELAQALFVSLMLVRLTIKRWPVLALAAFAAIGLGSLALAAHTHPKLRAQYRGVLWHALYPTGLVLGAGADALLARRKRVVVASETPSA